jgi:hypothetical protein
MDDAHSNSPPHQSSPDDDAVIANDAAISNDAVIAAIDCAAGALRRLTNHATDILEAFDRAAGMREAGTPYREIAEEEPLFVDFSAGPFRDLSDAFSALRRTQARALYDEGMTMAQLGRLLGVTRQRIAVLLGTKRDSSGDD